MINTRNTTHRSRWLDHFQIIQRSKLRRQRIFFLVKVYCWILKCIVLLMVVRVVGIWWISHIPKVRCWYRFQVLLRLVSVRGRDSGWNWNSRSIFKRFEIACARNDRRFFWESFVRLRVDCRIELIFELICGESFWRSTIVFVEMWSTLVILSICSRSCKIVHMIKTRVEETIQIFQKHHDFCIILRRSCYFCGQGDDYFNDFLAF